VRTRLRLLPEFLGVVAFGFVLYGVMLALEGSIESNTVLFSFETWLKEAPGNPLYRFLWFFGDVNEAEFYASLLGGIGILVFAYVAYRLDEAGSIAVVNEVDPPLRCLPLSMTQEDSGHSAR
jgi:hypothetical protein